MNDINPAWKSLLDKLPPALHKLIIPELEAWDKGVQDKFQEIHNEYEAYKPFKPFVDNDIDPEYAWQSVVFADKLQRDPGQIVSEINQHWDLGLVTKDEYEKAVQQAQNNPPANEEDEDMFETGNQKIDLDKIPEFAAMKQTLETLQGSEEEKRRKEQEAADIAAFEAELDELEKANEGKPFHRMFVTALMAQGLSGEEAVKQYHQILGENVDLDNSIDDPPVNTDAPLTMGNNGTAGSGSGDGAIDWASMPTSDFNANVAKILEAQMGSD
jgi:hypothetical protein